jgi:hypothetical protein
MEMSMGTTTEQTTLVFPAEAGWFVLQLDESPGADRVQRQPILAWLIAVSSPPPGKGSIGAWASPPDLITSDGSFEPYGVVLETPQGALITQQGDQFTDLPAAIQWLKARWPDGER